MNELKDLLEDLQDYFSNKSDAETVANVEYMLAQRIGEQLASPSEEEMSNDEWYEAATKAAQKDYENNGASYPETFINGSLWARRIAASLRSPSEQEVNPLPFEFVRWYSGMQPSQILQAFQRWKGENCQSTNQSSLQQSPDKKEQKSTMEMCAAFSPEMEESAPIGEDDIEARAKAYADEQCKGFEDKSFSITLREFWHVVRIAFTAALKEFDQKSKK
jgi:hypothetical protein